MKIVVVDDSKLMRTFIRVHLIGAGHQVVEADPSSQFEVMEVLRREQPDLLISDYEMPHCNGETLVSFVREDPVLKNTRILIVSAHSENDLVERLGSHHLCGYLLKPLTPEALVHSVRLLDASPQEKPDPTQPIQG